MGPLIYNFVTLRRAQQWARGVLRETLHCHALLGLMEPRLIDNASRSFLFFPTYPSSDPSSSQILLYSSLFPYIQLYILITFSFSVSIQRIGGKRLKINCRRRILPESDHLRFLSGGSSTGASCGRCDFRRLRNSRRNDEGSAGRCWGAWPNRPRSSRCPPRRRSCPLCGTRACVPRGVPGRRVRRSAGHESRGERRIDATTGSPLVWAVPWGWNRLSAVVEGLNKGEKMDVTLIIRWGNSYRCYLLLEIGKIRRVIKF